MHGVTTPGLRRIRRKRAGCGQSAEGGAAPAAAAWRRRAGGRPTRSWLVESARSFGKPYGCLGRRCELTAPGLSGRAGIGLQPTLLYFAGMGESPPARGEIWPRSIRRRIPHRTLPPTMRASKLATMPEIANRHECCYGGRSRRSIEHTLPTRRSLRRGQGCRRRTLPAQRSASRDLPACGDVSEPLRRRLSCRGRRLHQVSTAASCGITRRDSCRQPCCARARLPEWSVPSIMDFGARPIRSRPPRNLEVLTESEVSRSWSKLFKSGEFTETTFDRAEALLEELRGTSPLRHRLQSELEELRELHAPKVEA